MKMVEDDDINNNSILLKNVMFYGVSWKISNEIENLNHYVTWRLLFFWIEFSSVIKKVYKNTLKFKNSLMSELTPL